jgi:two-component system response regulator DegU
MDFDMAPMDGLTATEALVKQFPHARVLLVTSHDGDDLREAVRKAGALGFVRKDDLFKARDIMMRARAHTSNIEHRTWNIEHRTSNMEHRTSNIEHGTSNIEHRTSNIEHSVTSAEKEYSMDIQCFSERRLKGS